MNAKCYIAFTMGVLFDWFNLSFSDAFNIFESYRDTFQVYSGWATGAILFLVSGAILVGVLAYRHNA